MRYPFFKSTLNDRGIKYRRYADAGFQAATLKLLNQNTKMHTHNFPLNIYTVVVLA